MDVVTKTFVKIPFLFLFSLLWWKTVYFWSLITLNFTQQFFSQWGLSCPSGGYPPHQNFRFPLEFWKNVWWCYHKEGFECKKQKHIFKKPGVLIFGRYGWNCPNRMKVISKFSKITIATYPKNRSNQPCSPYQPNKQFEVKLISFNSV